MYLNQKKIEEVILETYRRLYKASEPVGDFDKLMAEAELNDLGQKIIPFDDYVIDISVMDDIITKTLKEFKVSKNMIPQFKTTIYLGCSPKSKNSFE